MRPDNTIDTHLFVGQVQECKDYLFIYQIKACVNFLKIYEHRRVEISLYPN